MLERRGIYALLAMLGLFVVLHQLGSPSGHDTRTVVGTMFGGVAFLLMTASIVLSTRLETLEDWFGGLDRVYQVHRVAGVSAALTALVHFFAIPKDLPPGADPVANALVPSAPLGMLALIVLIIALALTLNRKVSYSAWRPTHKLMGLVYILVVGHVMTAPAAFFDRFAASGVMLMVAAIVGVSAFAYAASGFNRPRAYRYGVSAVNHLERATEVVLEPLASALQHKAGQFAFVEVQGRGWTEPHPFTISSAPGDETLRFTMKVLGDWTRKVRHELEPGATVLVRGPYGRFDPTWGTADQVWLAGGIGITPFLSAVRGMRPCSGRHIHLVYAARAASEAVFLEELVEHAAHLPQLTLVPLFSNDGDFARVDMMKTRLPHPLPAYAFCLCGPKPMVEGLIRDLRADGVPRRQIRTEAFEFR